MMNICARVMSDTFFISDGTVFTNIWASSTAGSFVLFVLVAGVFIRPRQLDYFILAIK